MKPSWVFLLIGLALCAPLVAGLDVKPVALALWFFAASCLVLSVVKRWQQQ